MDVDRECAVHIIRGPLSCLSCKAELAEFDCVFIVNGVEECEDLVSTVTRRDVMVLRCSHCRSIFHFIAGVEFHDFSHAIH